MYRSLLTLSLVLAALPTSALANIPSTSTDDDADGYSTGMGDCDDDDPSIHPDATEVMDTIDNDCDGYIDGGPDFDSDGFRDWKFTYDILDMRWESTSIDCDDDNPSVNPGVVELPFNHVDDNCDGDIDPIVNSDNPLPEMEAFTLQALNPYTSTNCALRAEETDNGSLQHAAYWDCDSGSGASLYMFEDWIFTQIDSEWCFLERNEPTREGGTHQAYFTCDSPVDEWAWDTSGDGLHRFFEGVTGVFVIEEYEDYYCALTWETFGLTEDLPMAGIECRQTRSYAGWPIAMSVPTMNAVEVSSVDDLELLATELGGQLDSGADTLEDGMCGVAKDEDVDGQAFLVCNIGDDLTWQAVHYDVDSDAGLEAEFSLASHTIDLPDGAGSVTVSSAGASACATSTCLGAEAVAYQATYDLEFSDGSAVSVGVGLGAGYSMQIDDESTTVSVTAGVVTFSITLVEGADYMEIYWSPLTTSWGNFATGMALLGGSRTQ